MVIYSISIPCLLTVQNLSNIHNPFTNADGFSLFIRYLSDHGYNLATDSGSMIDTQKIVKRLLDVCIDSLNLSLCGIDYLGHMNEPKKK